MSWYAVVGIIVGSILVYPFIGVFLLRVIVKMYGAKLPRGEDDMLVVFAVAWPVATPVAVIIGIAYCLFDAVQWFSGKIGMFEKPSREATHPSGEGGEAPSLFDFPLDNAVKEFEANLKPREGKES